MCDPSSVILYSDEKTGPLGIGTRRKESWYVHEVSGPPPPFSLAILSSRLRMQSSCINLVYVLMDRFFADYDDYSNNEVDDLATVWGEKDRSPVLHDFKKSLGDDNKPAAPPDLGNSWGWDDHDSSAKTNYKHNKNNENSVMNHLQRPGAAEVVAAQAKSNEDRDTALLWETKYRSLLELVEIAFSYSAQGRTVGLIEPYTAEELGRCLLHYTRTVGSNCKIAGCMVDEAKHFKVVGERVMGLQEEFRSLVATLAGVTLEPSTANTPVLTQMAKLDAQLKEVITALRLSVYVTTDDGWLTYSAAGSGAAASGNGNVRDEEDAKGHSANVGQNWGEGLDPPPLAYLMKPGAKAAEFKAPVKMTTHQGPIDPHEDVKVPVRLHEDLKKDLWEDQKEEKQSRHDPLIAAGKPQPIAGLDHGGSDGNEQFDLHDAPVPEQQYSQDGRENKDSDIDETGAETDDEHNNHQHQPPPPLTNPDVVHKDQEDKIIGA